MNSVVKRGNQWCVVHGHPQKPGSKTDKPEGTVIKCFSTKKQADAMHRAIMANEGDKMNKNERGKGQGVGGDKQGDGGTDTCTCPSCGATAKHDRGTPCMDMSCPKCGTKMIGSPSVNENKNLKHLMSSLIHKDQIDGEDYYVVPTVLMVEGVHTGLDGEATYYPNEQLAKFPEAWNGRPVVVTHPDLNGHPVTASSPEMIERQTVGTLFNCTYKDNKLKGESWIKIDKCQMLSPEIMDMLQKNLPIEVSTGVYIEKDMEKGVWNSESYDTTAFNYRPDHLALLPGETGACSWQDGAGMPRLNQKGGSSAVKDNSIIALVKGLMNAVGIKTKEGSLNALELSHEAIRRAISEKVNKDSPGGADEIGPYIVDVFDEYVIYENDSKTWKQAYSIDATEDASLTGNAIEVKREVSYVPVKATTNLQKKENKKGGPDMDRKEKVDSLITSGSWGEDDREFLTELKDVQFEKVEKLVQNQNKEEKKDKKDEVTLDGLLKADPSDDESEATKVARVAYNKAIAGEESSDKDEAKDKEDEKPQTVEEFINNAPGEMKDTLGRAYKRDKKIKEDLVKSLIDNKRNEFSKEDLETKSLAELESLVKLGQIEVDFSGKNPDVSDDDDKAPEMARMEWGEKKKKEE